MSDDQILYSFAVVIGVLVGYAMALYQKEQDNE